MNNGRREPAISTGRWKLSPAHYSERLIYWLRQSTHPSTQSTNTPTVGPSRSVLRIAAGYGSVSPSQTHHHHHHRRCTRTVRGGGSENKQTATPLLSPGATHTPAIASINNARNTPHAHTHSHSQRRRIAAHHCAVQCCSTSYHACVFEEGGVPDRQLDSDAAHADGVLAVTVGEGSTTNSSGSGKTMKSPLVQWEGE